MHRPWKKPRGRASWRWQVVAAATAVAAVAAALSAPTAGTAAAADTPSASAAITVDGRSVGRVYDGVGATSGGGATTRLLLDYPEQERNEVLDYLFKPGYGAALQLLKVEIGGDTNSTDGSESSHMHERGVVNCNAGYEWWLMEEAVERNPDIKLGGLAWGAPGWLDEYYSQDTINYFLSWLGCADRHGLHIDNMGVRNERDYNAEWIKKFRAALDDAGYDDVRIIGADQAAVKGEWPIAVDMAADPELFDAVDLLGTHYSFGPSSETAQSLGKPLWISEGGPWSAEWGHGGSAKSLPSLLNHAYIEGRITGVNIWNLLTAYYGGLSISDAGLMRSNTPWSGAYQVQSAIWAVAQTTQFAEPGWRYLDTSSGYIDQKDTTQGSYVSRRSPHGGDWSTVIETMGATEPQQVTLSVTGGLDAGNLHVWRTTADKSFTRQPDLRRAADGTYRVTVPANAVLTVSNTKGQGRGDAVGQPDSAFPFPYHDDLSHGGPSGQTRYFSQMEGAYEERACQGHRRGTCLTQVSSQPAISWAAWKKPAGILGDLDWSDYSVSVDAFVPKSGEAQVLGRVSNDAMQPVPNGYGVTLAADGAWSIGRGEQGGRSWKELAGGTVDGAGPGWHRLKLAFDCDEITASVDGTTVGSVTDGTWVSGMAGLSADYSATQFADLAVEPLDKVVGIDDAVSDIRYAGHGWKHCTAKPGRCGDYTRAQTRAASGGTISGSNRDGDALTVTFDGTQATLVGARSPHGGTALVSIDGNAPELISFARSDKDTSVRWRTPVLTDGKHTLRIEVERSKGAGWVGLDRVEVIAGRGHDSSVDDQETGAGEGRLDYRGDGWLSCPGCINRTGLYHSSVTSTSGIGDSVDFRFTGTSVDLYGLRASNQGVATVMIDGKEVGTADFYGRQRVGNQTIWSSGELKPGKHTVTLRSTGAANDSASGTEINVDRFVVRH
ncbi:galactosylceramidase [Streptomyces sp. AD681]|uniref:galactosylceramidase n=1 Tax=Streptomyces sp. AD681 TaxID=3019069 RepID=UPI0022F19FDF|nr:galactosylceramidase [Streptomyces sp. AD681]MDA5139891.1 galactosylceramidase [Streptomyces sp. AD681]